MKPGHLGGAWRGVGLRDQCFAKGVVGFPWHRGTFVRSMLPTRSFVSDAVHHLRWWSRPHQKEQLAVTPESHGPNVLVLRYQKTSENSENSYCTGLLSDLLFFSGWRL